MAEASALAASIQGCHALIVDIPVGFRNEHLTFETSDSSFAELKAERDSDLSLKRNLGLLLARLMRWEKIMFLDDDIFDVTVTELAKIASQLDSGTRRKSAFMHTREAGETAVGAIRRASETVASALRAVI